MENDFSLQTTIGYFGTDNELKLTPSSLAVYFQDLAINHSNALGYTLEWLGAKRRGWAITNWHIQILRSPSCGETINIHTWCSKCRRLQAERSFRVESESGEALAFAVSRWIYMDLEKRRPTPIEDGMEKKYISPDPMAIEDEKYFMPKWSEENLLSTREFTVTRRDTDTNGHANNTKYIEWAVDDVPDEIYHYNTIEDIRVVYRKECYKDSLVRSKCYQSSKNSQTELICLFVSPEDEKTIYAEVSMLWGRKNTVPTA